MVVFNKFETEKFFLETLERILKNRSEYKILYVNVSKLKPKNRHPQFVKIIARLFDDLVAVSEGRLFVFRNGDCVILGKNLTEKNVENTVEKLKRGLITDPIWLSKGVSEFTHLYYPNDFDSVREYVENLMNSRESDEGIIQRIPLDAGDIDVVRERLDEINLTDLVKRQKVLRLDGPNKFTLLFEEFFVAVKDLNKRFDKTVDLTANKWLFLYLTQILDGKTMSSFMFSDIKNQVQKISLNLNLSTMFSTEFDDFIKILEDRGQKIVVEVQLMDILNNMRLYFDAKELLHHRGHEILIDSASVEMLQAFNIKTLEADYIKIFWHALMEDYSVFPEKLEQLVGNLDQNSIILAKCLDDKALRWGIKNNIRAFQGPYIDLLDVALTRAKCPNGKICSAMECLKRKRYIAGPMRDGCDYKEFLEKGSE